MNNNLTTIYIVRHAESEGNAGINQDRNTPRDLGSPLTDTGRSQAQKLAEKLTDTHFDAIFASPLSRARETAEILNAERKLVIITKDSLKERVRGNLNGQDENELRKVVSHIFGNPETLSNKEMWEWRMFEDMETADESLSRALTELREIAVAYPGQTVMVVTHGNIMRGLLVKLEEGTFKDFQTNTVKNTGYIKLESDGVDFFIKETHLVQKKEQEGNEE